MVTGSDRAMRGLKAGVVVTCLLALAMFWCLGGGTAAGYVLQGPFVLELMAKKLEGASTLKVTQQVTIEDPTVSAEPLTLSETLSYIFPSQFRSEMVYQDSQRIHVVSHGQELTIVDGRITAAPDGRFDRYKDLLLYNSDRLLYKTLAENGVDVGVCSLGHSGDQIVYVIGARYPDDSVSQLWVDKDEFLPLRWLTVRQSPGASEPGDRWEFVYTGWQKVDGVFYPFNIQTYHNGQHIRSIRVSKVDANAVIDAQSMDIAHLRALYREPEPPPAVQQQSQPDGRPGVEEAQPAIEGTKRKIKP